MACLIGPVQASDIVAVCSVGYPSGDFTCYEVAFSAPDYRLCTDRPGDEVGRDGGGGVLAWGNVVGGKFEPEGRAVYEWSGRQAQAGGVAFALVGVDEDRVFGDGMDRVCTEGRFWR